MTKAKSINLFMPDGSYESTIEATMLGWSGTGYKVTRKNISNFQKDKKDVLIGIYFLITHDDDNKEGVYIGESMDIVNRLQQHIRDYNSGKEKYYWTEAIFFSCNSLNKSYIHWLENHFYKIAKEADRYEILTKNTYTSFNLKKHEEASLLDFSENIKLIVKSIGYKFLTPITGDKTTTTLNNIDLTSDSLYLNRRNYNAIGKIVDNGFLIMKDSKINNTTSASLNKKLKDLKEYLIKEGIIKDYVFTKDYLFSSPSSAASIITGTPSSGPLLWVDKDGKSLKDKEN